MSLGYTRPLYLLPFDHRHSYLTGMFHATPPLTVDQRQAVIDSKRVIYDGFRQALLCGVPSDVAGILVDEEFGADILLNAEQEWIRDGPIDRKKRFGRVRVRIRRRIRAAHRDLPAYIRQGVGALQPRGRCCSQ